MSEETALACPECDAAGLERRKTKRPEWHCRECKNEFDEPVERKDRSGFMNGSLSDQLHMANPDDVSRETAGLE